jgi:putative transposase
MGVRTKFKLTGPAIIFITTSTREFTPVFADHRLADIVTNIFIEAIKYFELSLVGFVLMPTHVHALVGFKKAEKLSHFMRSFKILSSKAIKQSVNKALYHKLFNDGRYGLWQPRYDDFVIISEKQFKFKLEYIHNNPVKAGLVANSVDWKYSSAANWLTDSQGILHIDKNHSWCE